MMKTRRLGPWEVSSIGLCCMPMSGFPPTAFDIVKNRDRAIATIHAALDLGITLLDTADIYAPSWNTMGHNEVLVAEGLRSWKGTPEQKAKVVIATKGGITREPGDDWFGKGGRSADVNYLMRAVEASAGRLGVQKIQLWQHHRLNHDMPYEQQIENVMMLRQHGYVEHIGVSNLNSDQLKVALKVGGSVKEGGIISVQNEFSPRYRHGQDVVDLCEANGLAFFPWSNLGGVGSGANLENGSFGKFNEIGARKGASPYAVTIAWHLKRSSAAIPIPGASRPESITDTATGVALELTDAEFEELNASLPANAPLHDELVTQPPLMK